MNNCVLKRDKNKIVEHIQSNKIDIIFSKALHNCFIFRMLSLYYIEIGQRNILIHFLINLCNVRNHPWSISIFCLNNNKHRMYSLFSHPYTVLSNASQKTKHIGILPYFLVFVFLTIQVFRMR